MRSFPLIRPAARSRRRPTRRSSALRITPLGNRPRLGSGIQLDMGDARGHFEGDTLVVETTNVRERTVFRGPSSHLKLTERFKPMGPNAIEWSVTATASATS